LRKLPPTLRHFALFIVGNVDSELAVIPASRIGDFIDFENMYQSTYTDEDIKSYDFR
jgi:hypothetical protein